MAAKYLCWGDFTLTAPWRPLRACWPLSRQAGALTVQIATRTEGGKWEKGRQHGTSLYWFYTHAHATVDLSVGIAPDT